MPCRRLKLLHDLTPTIAETTGNFANSLLFSLFSGNWEPAIGHAAAEETPMTETPDLHITAHRVRAVARRE
jgi:hypothetical protein